MKRTMISAAFAIGLMAFTGAKAADTLSSAALEQLSAIATSAAARYSSPGGPTTNIGSKGPIGPTGSQPADDSRSIFNSNQNKLSNISQSAASMPLNAFGASISIPIVKVSGGKIVDHASRSDIIGDDNFVDTQILQITIIVINFDAKMNIVSTIIATADMNGNILSVSTDGANSAGLSHSQNSSSGGSSRGDSGGASSESM